MYITVGLVGFEMALIVGLLGLTKAFMMGLIMGLVGLAVGFTNDLVFLVDLLGLQEILTEASGDFRGLRHAKF